MSNNSVRYYTLDETVALAQSVSPESTDTERVFMDEWIYHGLRQMGVDKNSVKACAVKVNDLGIAKPRDFYSARDLVLVNSSGNEVDYIYRNGSRRIHTNINSKPRFVEISEDADFFHLSSDAVAADVTDAIIEYYALPSTEEGDLLIPEIKVFALMHFIKYMLAFRNSSPRLREYKQYWEKEAARIRSKGATPSQLEFKEGTARTYMSMITKPTRDRF